MSSFIFNIGIKIGDYIYRFALRRKNCKIVDTWKKISWRFYVSRVTVIGNKVENAKAKQPHHKN